MSDWSAIEINGRPAVMHITDEGSEDGSEWSGVITTDAKITSGDIYETEFGPISIMNDLGDGMFAFVGSGKYPGQEE